MPVATKFRSDNGDYEPHICRKIKSAKFKIEGKRNARRTYINYWTISAFKKFPCIAKTVLRRILNVPHFEEGKRELRKNANLHSTMVLFIFPPSSNPIFYIFLSKSVYFCLF